MEIKKKRIEGYQVEIMPFNGGKTKTVHISYVKYILPVDNFICKNSRLPKIC